MSFGSLGWVGRSGGGSSVGAWVRPADWPAMPATAANKIDILAAVTNDDSNFVALSATAVGGYTVDWGDGVVENVASTVQRDHKYTYSTLGTSVTSRGYKTALISIYPQSANSITAFDIGLKNATAGLAAYSNPWLDTQVNASACTSVTFRGGVESRWLERINILAIGAITSLSLDTCYALQAILFPVGSLASLTSVSFSGCGSLRSIEFPAGSLSLIGSLAYAFNSCYSLTSVIFPAGSLTSTTILDGAFNSCAALKTVSFPAGSLSLVTTMNSMFTGCSSLQYITFPAGSLVSVTLLASVVSYCYGLQSIAFPAGSLTLVTSMDSSFAFCNSLQSITFPAGALGSVSNTSNTFASCASLEKIVNCTIPISFTLPCNLSATELDAIYTSLPVVSAKTITVTGNYGTAADTPTIATTKGWTVTA